MGVLDRVPHLGRQDLGVLSVGMLPHLLRLALAIGCATTISSAGTTSIRVGNVPVAVVTDSALNRVYVANSFDNTLSVIDAGANQVSKIIQVGDGATPFSLAVDKDWEVVYVASYAKNFVASVDESTETIQLIFPQVGHVPIAMGANPLTHRLYVALHNDKAIQVIDPNLGPNSFVSTIALPHIPVSMTVNPKTNRIYVLSSDGSVLVVDGNSNTVTAEIPAGGTHGIAINPQTNRIYITTATGVAVIDAAKNSIVANVTTGPAPWAVAVNPLTQSVFVTDLQNSTVVVVDGQTNTTAGTLPVGHQPTAISVMESTGMLGVAENRVYVTNSADNTVSVLFDPKIPRDVITLPVRLCAIEGSSAAGMTRVPKGQMWTVGNSSTDSILLSLLRQASDSIWLPGAHIVFRSAVAVHLPIIADPDPPNPQIPLNGSLGDVNAANYEAESATAECNAAWAAMYPDQKGTIVVNARLLFNTGGIGETVGTSLELISISGARNGDLCQVPRQLTTSDATSPSVVVDDASDASKALIEDDPLVTLAHELGHTLLLGHGDGIDNDNDGTLPPNPGLRSYDAYCDPLGVINNNGDIEPKEDFIGQKADGCGSLMNGAGVCTTLRPLQVESARDVAQLVPGGVLGDGRDPAGQLTPRLQCGSFTCGIPPDIFLEKVEVGQTARTNITEFSHRMLGPIPPGAHNQYAVFANLSGREQQGCSPSSLGFPTRLQGAELVTSVSVRREPRGVQVLGSAWRCERGKFIRIRASDIRTRVSNQVSSEDWTSPSAVTVTIQLMPSAEIGNLRGIRMEAIARRMEESRSIHRLPEEGDNGTLISLIPPVLPKCSVAPEMIRPGTSATVGARELPANKNAEIYLGDQNLATVLTDAVGKAQATVAVPPDARPDLRLVTVQSTESTSAAVCTLKLFGDSHSNVAARALVLKQRLAAAEIPLHEGSEFGVSLSVFNPNGKAIKSLAVDEYFDPEYLEFVKSSVEPDGRLPGRLEWDDWTGSSNGFGTNLDPRRTFKAIATFRVKKCAPYPSIVMKMETLSGIDSEDHPVPRSGDTLAIPCNSDKK